MIENKDLVFRLMAEVSTHKHRARIQQLLSEFTAEMSKRATFHDLSKFGPEELNPLAKMQKTVSENGEAAYGTDDYKERLKILEPMLDHHYLRNSHHPEHYINGIDGMSLFDIVEMFFDWKAASERGDNSVMGLTASKERFNISDQLHNIFKNTCDDLKYEYV